MHSFRRMLSGLDAKGLAKSKPLLEMLGQIAARYQAGGVQATRAQVALNWLVSFHGNAVVAIPGASKVKQAFEASHALDFTLTQDELSALDVAARP